MLTVPEAAKRVGRDPETIRRWIRSGRLASRKVGTQHVIDESDLDRVLGQADDSLPPEWRRTAWGDPMPDIVSAIRRSRVGH
jgi:excisionase family DNA binding protein